MVTISVEIKGNNAENYISQLHAKRGLMTYTKSVDQNQPQRRRHGV